MADPLSDLKSWLRTSKDEVQGLAQAARSFAAALTAGGSSGSSGSSGRTGGLGLGQFSTPLLFPAAPTAGRPGGGGGGAPGGPAGSGPSTIRLAGFSFPTPGSGAPPAARAAVGVAAVAAVAGGGAYMLGETTGAVNMQQALFQGGLAAGDVSTSTLDRYSRMGAGSLGRFQTSVGSAQRTIAGLSELGFSPNSAAGKSMLANVGGISATTGMSNEQVGNILGTQMTNPGQTNMLRLLGIETFGKDGSVKDPGKVAHELLRKVYPTQKVTPEIIQLGLRTGGPLDLMIKAYFPDAGMQNVIRDQLRKIGMNGGNPSTNSAAEVSKLGLGSTASNPRIALMNYKSAESEVQDLTRNSQVGGYSSGLDAGAGLTERFGDLIEVMGPVVQGFAKLGSHFETFFGSTKPGGFLGALLNPRNILGGDNAPDTMPTGGGAGVLGGEVSYWPTMGSMNSKSTFGAARDGGSRTHKGMDTGMPEGSPIFSWREGVVTKAINNISDPHGNGNGGAGNYLEVQHAGGYLTRYLHVQPNGILVAPGQKVAAGQKIAKVGDTGSSSTPHLHFEIRKGGKAIDPWGVLNAGGTMAPSGDGTAAPTGSAGTTATGESAPQGSPSASFLNPGFKGVSQSSGLSGLTSKAQSLLDSGGGSYSAGDTRSSGAPSGSSSDTGGSASSSAPAGTTGVTESGIKGLAQQKASARGWTGTQWESLDWLVQHESAWKPTAQNPTSTAFGLFQFLNSTWKTVGASKTSDPGGQIDAGLAYISQRYGDPAAAKAFWQKNHWYDNGGWLEPGTTLTTNKTGKPEAILTSEQWDTLQSAARRPGVDAEDLAKRIGESVAGASGKSDGAVRPGVPRGQRPQVTIHVQLANASETEAQRLARRVKEILEEDTMYESIGQAR